MSDELEKVARAMRLASLQMSGYSLEDAAMIAEQQGYDQRDWACASAAIAALDEARAEQAMRDLAAGVHITKGGKRVESFEVFPAPPKESGR